MKNTKTTQKLDDAFLAFRQMMTTQLLKEAKGLGLSLSHFEIIMYLSHSGDVTMKDISEWLHITPPSVSTLIDVLVNKKLVKRMPSSKDRRTIHIVLSEESRELMHSMHKKKISIFKKMLSKLENEDQENLIRILNKCVINK